MKYINTSKYSFLFWSELEEMTSCIYLEETAMARTGLWWSKHHLLVVLHEKTVLFEVQKSQKKNFVESLQSKSNVHPEFCSVEFLKRQILQLTQCIFEHQTKSLTEVHGNRLLLLSSLDKNKPFLVCLQVTTL